MKTTNYFMACCLAAGVMLASCNEEAIEQSNPQPNTEDPTIIPGKYIVVFNEDYSPTGRSAEPTFTSRTEKVAYSQRVQQEAALQLDAFLEASSLAPEKVDAMFSSALTGFTAELSNDEVARLEKDPRVSYIEPDRVVTLDFKVEAVYTEEELSANSDQIQTEAQTTTCAISNSGGTANGSGKNTFIWIVDTGIDLDHPDLNVNRQYGRSFADNSPDDAQGHGTHVAGIAGAVNNSIGVVGISSGAQVVPVDVFGRGGSTATSTIIRGMDYVAANDIRGDVVNMSLGPRNRTGCSSNSAYRSALNRLNDQSRIALAAGNSADDAAFYDPGCQNLSNVFTVASMTCGRGFSSFSNYGSPVDWIATGSSVTSTYPGGRYATLSGTSMASPVVAGVLHARNGTPRQCGSVSFRGRTYRIACR